METKRQGQVRVLCTQFKSYYVVWKQDRRGGRIMFYSVFKSYYVVWKLRYGRNRKRTVGLNRTMQYGNSVSNTLNHSSHGSLNRTMQYGNCSIPCNLNNFTSCLNRTMQYGNAYDNFVYNLNFQKFKSYYVVWKRAYDNTWAYYHDKV